MKKFVTLAVLALASSAVAAPLLGTKASFNESNFCKAQGCKYVTTVPSGPYDQFVYDLKNGQRVIVWRYTNDQKRWWGKETAAVAGKITGIEAVWYGVQDSPMESTNTVAALFTAASGINVPKATAAKWLDSLDNSSRWGKFILNTSSSTLPGANAAQLHMTMLVSPYDL